MTAAAVVSHDDAQGDVAPHVLRLVTELRTVTDVVVVAARSHLSPTGTARLDGQARVVGAGGAGHTVAAWRTALASGLLPESGLDRLLLVDDSLVGPLVPLAEVLPGLPVGLRGLAAQQGPVPHLDFRLLDCGPTILRDPMLGAFWVGVDDLGDQPATAQRLAGDLCRWARAAGHAVRSVPPSAVLPFRALDGIRFAGAGRGRLLAGLEKEFPSAFAGVRSYLDRTDAAHGVRTHHAAGAASPAASS